MLNLIRTFVYVVDLNGFSKAADKLAISSSVVTRRISALETQLATQLIQRSTRQLTLTEAGHLFYERSLEMIRTFDDAKRSLQTLNNSLTGTLKIGLPLSIAHLHLSHFLHEFTEKHPELNIHIVNGNHLMNLLDDGFDLVIHCGQLPNSSFYSKKLGEWEQWYCASPRYLQLHGIPETPEELDKHNCLDHYDNFQHTWEFNEEHRVKSRAIAGSILANSSINLKNLAMNHLGIVCLPSFTIIEEVHTGTLTRLLKPFTPPSHDISIVYPSKKYQPQKVTTFIEFLQKWVDCCCSGVNSNHYIPHEKCLKQIKIA